MRNPLIALIWRQWRRTRWAIFMAGVATFMSLSFLSSRLFVLTSNTVTQSIVINSWILILLGIALASSNAEEKVLDQSSKFMWNLPVRTSVWARVCLGYNVIVVGLFALVITLVHFYACGDVIAPDKDLAYVLWRLPLFAIGVTSIMGSLFLLVSTLGNNWLGGIVSLVLFPLAIWVTGVFIFFSVKYHVPASAFLLGEIAVAYGMYYLAVTLSRRDAWSSVMARAPGSILRGRRGPFSSPLRALIWYEWKRFGWLFILGAAIVLPIAIIISMVRAQQYSVAFHMPFFLVFCEAFWYIVIAATGMGGYLTVRRYYDHATGFNVFHFTKPVTTRAIAFSRVAAMGLTLAGISLVPFIVLCLGYALTGNGAVLLSKGFCLVGLETIVGVFLANWMLTWFMMPLFYASAFFWIVVYTWLSVTDSRFSRPEEILPLALFFDSIFLIFTMVLFGTAIRRRYFDSKSVLGAVSIWLLALAFFIAFDVGIPSKDLMFLILTPVAALPFATIPLSIDWYRHR